MEIFVVIFMFVLFVAIMVAISRWVFRINDIVNRMDDIIRLLAKNNATIR